MFMKKFHVLHGLIWRITLNAQKKNAKYDLQKFTNFVS